MPDTSEATPVTSTKVSKPTKAKKPRVKPSGVKPITTEGHHGTYQGYQGYQGYGG